VGYWRFVRAKYLTTVKEPGEELERERVGQKLRALL